MAERERVLALLHQQPALHEGAQDGDHLVLARAGDRGQQVELGPAAQDRGGLDEAALLGRQPLHLAPHQLRQRPRQRLAIELDRVDVAGHVQDLLQEERVPTGPPVERVDEAGRGHRAVHRRQERADIGAAQPLQVDVVDEAATLEALQHLAAGQATGQLVRAARADDQRGRQGRRRQRLEDGHALGVGPVEVLEHDEAHGGADALLDGRHDAAQRIVTVETGRHGGQGACGK